MDSSEYMAISEARWVLLMYSQGNQSMYFKHNQGNLTYYHGRKHVEGTKTRIILNMAWSIIVRNDKYRVQT